MRCCSYCGKEYAGEVVVCPLDGRSVVEMDAKAITTASPPAATQASFAAKLVSPISRFGTYRVLRERSDLLFVQIEGGTKSAVAILAPLLGPAGGLASLVLWLSSRRRTNENDQVVDRQNPEALLRQSEANFRLFAAEIRDAAIEPRSSLATSGTAGRMILSVRHGEKMKFEFETVEEMANAIHLLPALLGSTLRINVEWDGPKHRFQGRKIV